MLTFLTPLLPWGETGESRDIMHACLLPPLSSSTVAVHEPCTLRLEMFLCHFGGEISVQEAALALSSYIPYIKY